MMRDVIIQTQPDALSMIHALYSKKCATFVDHLGARRTSSHVLSVERVSILIVYNYCRLIMKTMRIHHQSC
jgi:hypothetical protein